MAEDNGFRTINTMIQARNLTKRYGTISAADELSFEALAGNVTGFLGPNVIWQVDANASAPPPPSRASSVSSSFFGRRQAPEQRSPAPGLPLTAGTW